LLKKKSALRVAFTAFRVVKKKFKEFSALYSYYNPRMEKGGGRDFETFPRAPLEGISVSRDHPFFFPRIICGFIPKGEIRSNFGSN
jgi:hypothetical protein